MFLSVSQSIIHLFCEQAWGYAFLHVVPQLTPTLALPMVVCKVAVNLALQLLTQQ